MFISPSVYLTKCFLSKLCSLGQPLPKFAVVRNFVNHCNRAITFQALQPGGRLLFIADQQHTQSFNVRHAATGCFCSGCSGLSGCFGSRLHRLLGCSAALAALAACPPAPAICLPALAACLHSVRKGKKINLNPLYLIHLEG